MLEIGIPQILQPALPTSKTQTYFLVSNSFAICEEVSNKFKERRDFSVLLALQTLIQDKALNSFLQSVAKQKPVLDLLRTSFRKPIKVVSWLESFKVGRALYQTLLAMIWEVLLAIFIHCCSCQELGSIDGCLTLKEGQSCILPFTYQNVTYNGCITINDPDNLPWCSIQTYPGTDFHISGGGHWAHCDSNCPLHKQNLEGSEPVVVLRESLVGETCQTVSGENGICQPAATCVLLSPEEETAQTCSLNSHVCCQELLENSPTILNRLKEIGNQEKPTFEKPQEVSIEDVEDTLSSLRFGIFEVSF